MGKTCSLDAGSQHGEGLPCPYHQSSSVAHDLLTVLEERAVS